MNRTESSDSPESSGNVVVYATDGNPTDLERLRASARSALLAADGDLDIYVLAEGNLDPGIPGAVVLDPRPVLDACGFTANGWRRKWPYACMFRLAIPLLPELAQFDRVLYLDTDTLVRTKDFMRLFDVDDEGFEMACVKDVNGKWPRIARTLDYEIDRPMRNEALARIWKGRKVRGACYVNSGVAVVFIDNILANGTDWYVRRLRSAFSAVARGRLRYPDQDFINALMRVSGTLPPKFNGYATRDVPDRCIEHFISRSKGRQLEEARKMGLLAD